MHTVNDSLKFRLHSTTYSVVYPPGVYDVLLTPSQAVAVEDEITVSTIKMTIGGGIHRHLLTVLNTPNLKARQKPVLPQHSCTIFSPRRLLV